MNPYVNPTVALSLQCQTQCAKHVLLFLDAASPREAQTSLENLSRRQTRNRFHVVGAFSGKLNVMARYNQQLVAVNSSRAPAVSPHQRWTKTWASIRNQ